MTQERKVEVTVLMPVYNAEKYLRAAIDSVLSQSYKDFELLIIDDGSTDSSPEIIKTYTDPRIRVIRQKNGGVSAALNTGLQHAVAPLIARFDADDICYANRLAVQINFMHNHPDYVIAGSDADYMDKNGEYIFTFHNPGHSDEEIRGRFLMQCPFIHSSVIYRRSAVLELGGYEVKAHTFEDYFLWTKLLKKGKLCNFTRPLISVRFNPESVTVDARDYNRTFKNLRNKALQTGIITEEEGQLLRQSVQRLSFAKKEFSYNRMLAKKYLWNNYQPAKARQHLWKAIKSRPFNIVSYALLFLSMLPKATIDWVYAKVN